MGQAISALRDEGVLLFGSGMSFHNMRGFARGGGVSAALAASKACTWHKCCIIHCIPGLMSQSMTRAGLSVELHYWSCKCHL